MPGPETACPQVSAVVSEPALEDLAEILAECLEPGDLVALRGPLGAGKSTVARRVIRAAAARRGTTVDDVPSPTFTLVQTYAVGEETIWHFDLYRIGSADEIWELGFEEAAEGISLIEWPDNAGPHLPPRRLDIDLDHTGDPATRSITLTDRSVATARFRPLFDALSRLAA